MAFIDRFLTGHRIRADREFLPAALSILETPSSPIKIGLIWCICLLFVSALLWSYFGRIDIIATAQGKIEPTFRVKTIQPIDSGKVIALNVEDGQHVAKGDTLVELDADEASADRKEAFVALMGFRAERDRRLAALKAGRSDPPAQTGAIAFSSETSEAIRQREVRVLENDLDQLNSTLGSFDAQIVQKKAERQKLQDMIVSQDALIATLKERVTMRSSLLTKGAGSKASVLDAQEALQTQETALITDKGQLNETVAALDVLLQDRQKAISAFRSDNGEKLAEAERQIDSLEQRLEKAQVKLNHTRIISPTDGVVVGLSITTLGQVLNPSEEIMRIVPDDSLLEIECYVQNTDIAFIQPGQLAVVKVTSLPFTRYGVLEAKVVRIAHDAIPEPDAQTVEGNPAQSIKSKYFGGAQRTQNLVFPVTLSMERKFMDVDGEKVALSPGMSVSVEVKTSKRRILEYLFSPLAQTVSSAMKER